MLGFGHQQASEACIGPQVCARTCACFIWFLCDEVRPATGGLSVVGLTSRFHSQSCGQRYRIGVDLRANEQEARAIYAYPKDSRGEAVLCLRWYWNDLFWRGNNSYGSPLLPELSRRQRLCTIRDPCRRYRASYLLSKQATSRTRLICETDSAWPGQLLQNPHLTH